MEEVASLWSYQENIDELRKKLMYTTFELESTKMEANEEIKKSKEYAKHLLELLNIAYKERDEARDQLHKLLNKFTPSSPDEFITTLPDLLLESPIKKPTKANSSVTESNSLGSSPAASSPDLSNMNQPFGHDYSPSTQMGFISCGQNIDANRDFIQEFDVIESLVDEHKLPKKGKFLQAVIEAGPLLRTLLVAGPLPRWRNPPPIRRHQIPLVAIKTHDPEISSPNQNNAAKTSLGSSSYAEMSCGVSQLFPNSGFNFATDSSSLNNWRLVSSVPNVDDQILATKRQRFR